MLPEFLYKRHCARESLGLTGDVGLPDNEDQYDTSSKAEEEEIEHQVGEGSQRVTTLDGEAKLPAWKGVLIWWCYSIQ